MFRILRPANPLGESACNRFREKPAGQVCIQTGRQRSSFVKHCLPGISRLENHLFSGHQPSRKSSFLRHGRLSTYFWPKYGETAGLSAGVRVGLQIKLTEVKYPLEAKLGFCKYPNDPYLLQLVMNRLSLSVLLAATLLCRSARAASPEEESRFLAVVKRAFETNDTNSFLSLFYWRGVPDDLKQSISQTAKLSVEGHKVSVSVSIVSASADLSETEFVRDGNTYRPNLPIVAQVKIVRDLGSGSTATATFPLGENDGKLVLPQMAPVR